MRHPLLHPHTKLPLIPVGFRRDGRPIWPVLGGSEPPNQPSPPGGQPPATPPAPPSPPPAGPQRPDGVSEAEWAALGDPGKAALTRERAARTAAEQALAAARATPPAPPAPPPAPPKPAEVPKGPDGQPDIAAIVQQAVAAAVAPFTEAQAQRDADAAAAAIRDAVTGAAAARFHDATDALAQINLAELTDGTGRPDPQKITTALDDLLVRKPHLGKAVDTRRQAPPGALFGGTPGGGPVPLDDRVKATLARMQASSGVRFADQP